MKVMNLYNGNSGARLLINEHCNKIATKLTECEGVSVEYSLKHDGNTHTAVFTGPGVEWKILEDAGVVYVVYTKLRTKGNGTYKAVMSILSRECMLAGIRMVLKDVKNASFAEWCEANGFQRLGESNDFLRMVKR